MLLAQDRPQIMLSHRFSISNSRQVDAHEHQLIFVSVDIHYNFDIFIIGQINTLQNPWLALVESLVDLHRNCPSGIVNCNQSLARLVICLGNSAHNAHLKILANL